MFVALKIIDPRPLGGGAPGALVVLRKGVPSKYKICDDYTLKVVLLVEKGVIGKIKTPNYKKIYHGKPDNIIFKR